MSEKVQAYHKKVLQKIGYAHELARRIGGFSKFAISFSIICILAAVLPARASAQTGLNPPVPPYYTCHATGGGTVCHGKTTDAYQGGNDGACPQGFDILENGFLELTATRYYDKNGDLTRRVRHVVYSVNSGLNILYNSETGKSLPYTANFTETDDLAVPGDLNSATAKFIGNLYTVTLPGGGLLVHDVGVFVFTPDGSVLVDHGPKMLFFGDTAALCAALS